MRRLQEFGFEKSVYERPNQKWVCGRARDGQCCLAGPDARGHCTATTECRPLRKGDHWQCTRPNFLGGPCPDGPLPDGACCRAIPKCSPVRTVRSWRGLTVVLAVAATLAALLLIFGSTDGNEMVSPGELSFSHSSESNSCSQCHGSVAGRPAGWLLAGAGSHAAHDNSKLCLKCHNVGDTPLQPHSLAPSRLQDLTRASLKKNGRGSPPASLVLASFVTSPDHSGEGELACATCHKEHRGNEADLKKLTNRQCQSCHVTQFASLAHGHPPFTDYPFPGRTPIHFNHQSHLTRLKDPAAPASAPKACQDCHQPDLRGGTMTVKSFQVMCASCHDDQIKAIVTTGIAFIRIPQMDDRSLKGQYAIGEWPADADQTSINPFVRLLLSSDPLLRKALDTLQGVDLSNLPTTNAAVLKSAQMAAWGIKSLIFDLETGGQAELLKRVRLSTGRTLTDSQAEGLTAFVSADALRAAFAPIFTNLQNEVLAYRNTGKCAPTQMDSSPPPPPGRSVKVATSDAWVSQGGWYNDGASFALFYRPRGHADRFLRTWMDLTVDADRDTDPPISRELFKVLSAPKAVGLCTKCHGLEEKPVRQVNWMAFQPDPNLHEFNRFSHSTHLSLLNTSGCLTCHDLNMPDSQSKDKSTAAPKAARPELASFSGDFLPITKNRCDRCHQPNHVRDDCLLCHNYHIGRFKPILAHSDTFPKPPPAGKAALNTFKNRLAAESTMLP